MVEIPVVEEYGWHHYVWRVSSLAEAIRAWKSKRGPLTRDMVGELEEVEQPWACIRSGSSRYRHVSTARALTRLARGSSAVRSIPPQGGSGSSLPAMQRVSRKGCPFF